MNACGRSFCAGSTGFRVQSSDGSLRQGSRDSNQRPRPYEGADSGDGRCSRWRLSFEVRRVLNVVELDNALRGVQSTERELQTLHLEDHGPSRAPCSSRDLSICRIGASLCSFGRVPPGRSDSRPITNTQVQENIRDLIFEARAAGTDREWLLALKVRFHAQFKQDSPKRNYSLFQFPKLTCMTNAA